MDLRRRKAREVRLRVFERSAAGSMLLAQEGIRTQVAVLSGLYPDTQLAHGLLDGAPVYLTQGDGVCGSFAIVLLSGASGRRTPSFRHDDGLQSFSVFACGPSGASLWRRRLAT